MECDLFVDPADMIGKIRVDALDGEQRSPIARDARAIGHWRKWNQIQAVSLCPMPNAAEEMHK